MSTARKGSREGVEETHAQVNRRGEVRCGHEMKRCQGRAFASPHLVPTQLREAGRGRSVTIFVTIHAWVAYSLRNTAGFFSWCAGLRAEVWRERSEGKRLIGNWNSSSICELVTRLQLVS